MSVHDAWRLLDGALIGSAAAGEGLRAAPGAVALYSDLGEEAAHVGPWLIPASIDVDARLDRWRAEREDAALGIAWLRTSESASDLIAHLHRLRYVRAARKPSERFFLRYADQRTLIALWTALRPAQQRAWLGPIQSWRSRTLDGANVEFVPMATSMDAEVSVLPLSLDAKQFERLTDESRVGDLLVATIDAFPELRGAATLAQRYAFARAARAWCTARGIQQAALQIAILVAMIRTKGHALQDPAFAAASQAARAASDASVLLTWSSSEQDHGLSGLVT